MRVEFHPSFAEDVLCFGAQYESVRLRLSERFRHEID